jgi:golgi phosphoprotein 3
MLTLFDELYLLTQHADREKKSSYKYEKFYFGLAGSILAELALASKVQVNQKHRLELVDATSTGDEILDRALLMMQESAKPRKLTYWVEELTGKFEKITKRLTERLVSNGVFNVEDDELLWAIPSQVYPDHNASAKYCLKEHLRAIALADGVNDLRSLALLCLVDSTEMLDLVFTRDERREANRNIHEMLITEALKEPAAQAIEEIHNAVDSL